jgi:chemotaxis protein CheD
VTSRGAPISVGLGEVAATRAAVADHLVAHGLGSCIALCLYEPLTGVGGLAHIVLPGSDPANRPNGKFAGSALPALLAALAQAGGPLHLWRYQARLAGGAHVLAMGGGETLPRVGDMNVEAVKAALAAADVPVYGEDVGGWRGRTVWFDPREGGKIRIRTVGGRELQL